MINNLRNLSIINKLQSLRAQRCNLSEYYQLVKDCHVAVAPRNDELIRASLIVKSIYRNCLLATAIVIANTFFSVAQAEIATLFTTPQERQIINVNRYKRDEVEQAIQQIETPVDEEIIELVREEVEVKQSFLISGITVSSDGDHSVWINQQVYEDGEKIEGKSKVKVIVGSDVKVRITAPDGKHYYGTSGETVELSYLEVAE